MNEYAQLSTTSAVTTAWSGQCVDIKDNYILRTQRVLPGTLSNQMTPEKCIDICHDEGFLLAGLQRYYQCFCFNDNPPEEKVLNDTSCSFSCHGDLKKKCGDVHNMNVHEAKEGKILIIL